LRVWHALLRFKFLKEIFNKNIFLEKFQIPNDELIKPTAGYFRSQKSPIHYISLHGSALKSSYDFLEGGEGHVEAGDVKV
jgi:hypothetical protein